MIGHVRLPYIFIFDNAWACSVAAVVECRYDRIVA